jgi:hypothetical protein
MRDGLRLSPRFSSPGWGAYLEQAIMLLLTPTAEQGGTNVSPSPGAAVRPQLGTLVRLLPTPVEGDSRNSRQSTAPNPGPTRQADTLSDVAWRWSGAATSPRSGGGKPSPELRLSPWFVEWMIGAPAGWSDPDCPLSATEFRSRSASSPARTSSTSNETEGDRHVA